MITFIVPLKSQQVSTDWEKVCKDVNATLRSCCSQDDSRFRTILVCNTLPENIPPLRNLEVICEKFNIPAKGEGMKDKFEKIRRALVHLKTTGGTDGYGMVVDADDLVSFRIARFIETFDSRPSGFLFDRGYYYSAKYNEFIRCNRLNQVCGSTYAVDLTSGDLPDSTELECDHPLITKGHTIIRNYFDKLGKPLFPVKFRAVAYVTDTGENDSNITTRPKSTRIRLLNEFRKVRFHKRVYREFSII